ncbi:hypothetical protein F4819DRAFT_53982 [Hypoxylon fuscum]|nr:hypothetical protein F4819DRAFT_53982 [Hypoxylon fuscum]
MAMHRHLSLVFLLTPLAVAQAYSGGDDLLDATITKSVTETVTKYLSECGIAPTPFDGPNATFPGTTTVTSTLQSTISVVVSSNLTDVSGVAPTGLGPSQSDVVYSLTSTHTSSVTGIDGCSGFNCSTSPVQNGTTKIPCSTATVIVPASGSTSTLSLSTTHGVRSTTPVYATSSAAATNVSPSQIPVNESVKLGASAAVQSFLGALGIVVVMSAGFW